MTHPSVNTSQLCIGIDLGDMYSHVCAFDRATGEILEEGRLRTTPAAFRARFAEQPACRIAIEVGSQSPWVSRLLEGAGHEVVVANAHRLHLFSAKGSKSDKIDARYLARLVAADPMLLHPIEHRTEQSQVHRCLLTARDRTVECRTKLVNAVRGMAKSLGTALPKCDADAFHHKGRGALPKELEETCAPLFELLAGLTRAIRTYDREIERLSEQEYPETARLRQVAGVGPITALDFVLTIEDPTRFAKSRNVGAYLGLSPKKSSSGARDPELSITKAGDVRLRRNLNQCSQYVLGRFGPDCDLRRWGTKLAARGGKNAKKRAIVAVARKLSVLLHRLWITGEPYEPLRNAERLKRMAR
jgi:transposase